VAVATGAAAAWPVMVLTAQQVVDGGVVHGVAFAHGPHVCQQKRFVSVTAASPDAGVVVLMVVLMLILMMMMIMMMVMMLLLLLLLVAGE
jgi:hypothetical protein